MAKKLPANDRSKRDAGKRKSKSGPRQSRPSAKIEIRPLTAKKGSSSVGPLAFGVSQVQLSVAADHSAVLHGDAFISFRAERPDTPKQTELVSGGDSKITSELPAADFSFVDSSCAEFLSNPPSASQGSRPPNTTTFDPNSHIIHRRLAGDAKSLFQHQHDAIESLNSTILPRQRAGRPFAGIMVFPTGGGKTLTAVHWVLRNVVDARRKVLWLAHRHELLEQACKAFRESASLNVLPNRETIHCRLVSGLHGQPVTIQADDDVVIASIHSLRANSFGYEQLNARWLTPSDDLFVVLDEAHHAPARTYRELLAKLRKDRQSHGRTLHLLGLTATPFRTAEREQGQIAKLFPDDMVVSVDLQTLLEQEILSRPIFRSFRTHVNLRDGLSEDEVRRLESNGFQWELLGDQIAASLGNNAARNQCIVEHYIEHRTKFKATLVFALNVANAIALNALFRKRGVRSDYVVGEIRDITGTRNLSPQENPAKIAAFREGRLDVLINVMILTEGTDLPCVNTVFLARPTSSRTLAMQMIGRGLRGPRSGGTKETYIVNFVDDWQEKIVWINPEQLYIDENVDFDDRKPATRERIIRLVSIQAIEEFARQLGQSLDSADWESLDFLDCMPVGVYAFFVMSEREDAAEIPHNVLVFNSTKTPFAEFVAALPELLKTEMSVRQRKASFLDGSLLDDLTKRAEATFFGEVGAIPGYQPDDIRAMIQYYHVYGIVPQFVEFEDRERFDMDRLARQVVDLNMGRREEAQWVDRAWNDDPHAWQVFFGFDKGSFLRQVDAGIRRILHPELCRPIPTPPRVDFGTRELADCTLEELRTLSPERYSNLRSVVEQRSRTPDGLYRCALSGQTSSNRNDFEIDHIVPRSKGGKTVAENLQLSLRRENRRKGAQ